MTPLLALALAACAAPGAGDGDDGPATDPSPAGEPSSDPNDPTDPTDATGDGADGVPADLIEAIRADAARQAAVELDDVEVVSAEEVTWTDGSLGCPEPGMMYTQALVDGYQVVVRAGEVELDYRADGGGTFRICQP